MGNLVIISLFVGVIFFAIAKKQNKLDEKKAQDMRKERIVMALAKKAEQEAREEARKTERLAEQEARKAEQAEREATRKAERLAEQKARLLENIEKQALIMNNSLTHPRFKKIMEAHKANYYASLAQNATENVNAAFIALGDNVKNYLDDMPISSFLVKTKNNINIEVSAINCYSTTYLLNI